MERERVWVRGTRTLSSHAAPARGDWERRGQWFSGSPSGMLSGIRFPLSGIRSAPIRRAQRDGFLRELVMRLDVAETLRLRAHQDAVRDYPAALHADTAAERAVGDAGGAEDDIGPAGEVIGVEDFREF